MNSNDFESLVASIKEVGRIKWGSAQPARSTVITVPDIKTIRQKLDVTQVEFAHFIGVSENTIRNWEQGRRHPEGPAVTLLRIVDKNPALVFAALHA